MAGFEGLIHSKIPTGDGIESIDDAVQSIRLLVHLSEPATTENSRELAVLLREDVRPRPAIGAVGTERSPVLAISQIGRWFSGAAALRLHAAAGDQLAQHLTEHGSPLVHRRRPAFGMHCPLRRIAADRPGELPRTLRQKISEPTFPLRGHFEEFVDRFHVSPFKLQAIGLFWTKKSFFPSLEGDAGAA